MSFKVQEKPVPDRLERLELFYDKDQEPAKKSKAVGSMVFFIRGKTGSDEMAIGNVGYDGKGNIQVGSSNRELVVRSVVKIEGLEDPSGKSIETMTPELHDQLPSWVTNAILWRCLKKNAIGDAELGE